MMIIRALVTDGISRPCAKRAAGSMVKNRPIDANKDLCWKSRASPFVSNNRVEMMFQRLVPKIFYERMADGLDLFVDGLGFAILYRDDDMAIVARQGAKAYIVESAEFAAKDRPEIAIETDAIHEAYADIRARRPDLLHPNGDRVTKKPWGLLEFALRDKTDVCVIFRQPA
jgi:hypothetical protein